MSRLNIPRGRGAQPDRPQATINFAVLAKTLNGKELRIEDEQVICEPNRGPGCYRVRFSFSQSEEGTYRVTLTIETGLADTSAVVSKTASGLRDFSVRPRAALTSRYQEKTDGRIALMPSNNRDERIGKKDRDVRQIVFNGIQGETLYHFRFDASTGVREENWPHAPNLIGGKDPDRSDDRVSDLRSREVPDLRKLVS